MLVQFSVENYRSVAERQVLSLVASSGSSRRHHNSVATENSFAPRVLRSACLFGPNGAGKSTIIKAIGFMEKFVLSSAGSSTEGDRIEVEEFRLDPFFGGKPSTFEVIFTTDVALYQYGFSVDQNRVWSEWLFVRNNGSGSRMRLAFERHYDVEQERYDWEVNESYVKGDRETWKQATRENSLFLSSAVLLNAEIFKDPFSWFRRSLRIIASPERLRGDTTAKMILEEQAENRTVDFLKSTGVSVAKLSVEEQEFKLPKGVEEVFRENFIQGLLKDIGSKSYDVKFLHSNSESSLVPFDLSSESDGTQVLFSLAGPWLEVLERGWTLFVDELHNSLHPMALRHLVNMFHDPDINRRGAQLIFTSHETSVMSRQFMHRDQIWFLDKEDGRATRLYPLSDFKVRDLDGFQRSYLAGKYGGLPAIGSYWLD